MASQNPVGDGASTPTLSTSPVPAGSESGCNALDFSHAMEQLIVGKEITRKEWQDKEEYGLMKDGWLEIHHKNGNFHIWKVSEADMVATDWVVV